MQKTFCEVSEIGNRNPEFDFEKWYLSATVLLWKLMKNICLIPPNIKEMQLGAYFGYGNESNYIKDGSHMF
ncbi:hypothetical protein MKW98_013201 [Papaver atlanticum]|uniref:Uncharacterized protein n=1 Tax=Papaver atlanticum TaxID=357466 RepID=A0AAD4SGT7_9MAGN|nr:hypothetical protein MKW98_013201 [Papaver atlanticum]